MKILDYTVPLFFFLFFLLSVPPAYSQGNANLKERSNKEIVRRVREAEKAATRVKELETLTSEQKNALSSQLSTYISNLKTLQSKIKTDSDPAIRSDAQELVKNYKLFALYIPKMHLLSSADRMIKVCDEYIVVEKRLYTRLAKVRPNNYERIQSDILALESVLNEAKGQVQSIADNLLALTPEEPGYKEALKSSRAALVAVYTQKLIPSRGALDEVFKTIEPFKRKGARVGERLFNPNPLTGGLAATTAP